MASMFAPNQILKTAAPDFLKDLDLTDDELLYLLDLAAEVKTSPADYAHALDGKNPSPCCSKSRRSAPSSPSISP